MVHAEPVNAEHFRHAMAQMASTVSVVTVGCAEERTGLTVTSMTSVSVAPPTLLFCINRKSSTWPLLEESRRFGVNVLGAWERDLADQFAGRTQDVGNQRYEGREWSTLTTGAPILTDALVAFDCEIDQTIRHQTHEIVIGIVRAVAFADSAQRPLIYWRRAYDEINRWPVRSSAPLRFGFGTAGLAAPDLREAMT